VDLRGGNDLSMKREIIPVILAKNFSDFKNKLATIKKLRPKPRWIQIDVVDGKFAPYKTWAEPKKVAAGLQPARHKKRRLKTGDYNIEVDLMVVDPLKHAKAWIKAGAKRILFHVERDRHGLRPRDDIMQIIQYIKKHGAEEGLSLNPDTPISMLAPYLTPSPYPLPGGEEKGEGKQLLVDCVLFLGVNPGKSGQSFQRHVLKKISALRKTYPHLPIEVDGGVNLSNAEELFQAGATRLAAASAIYGASNPQDAYNKLLKLTSK